MGVEEGLAALPSVGRWCVDVEVPEETDAERLVVKTLR